MRDDEPQATRINLFETFSSVGAFWSVCCFTGIGSNSQIYACLMRHDSCCQKFKCLLKQFSFLRIDAESAEFLSADLFLNLMLKLLIK